MKSPRCAFVPLLAALLGLLVGPAAEAGVVFRATRQVTTPNGRLPGIGSSKVEGRVDGQKARIEILESSRGIEQKGDWLLTENGGASVRRFDVEKELCTDWLPIERRLPSQNSVSSGRFRNVRVAKTVDEAGGKIVRTATRHLRIETAYDAVYPHGDKEQAVHTSRIDDLWVAESLTDPGLAVWLGIPGAPVDGGEIDRAVAETLDGLRGAVLRRRTKLTTRVGERDPLAVTTSLEVTRLRRRRLSAKTFETPFRCKNPSQEVRP